MSSKRKREDDDVEFTPSSKMTKTASEEVTRSGRVRKKPARFKDTEDDDDEEEEEEEISDDVKTSPTPVVIQMTQHKVISIPVPITKPSQTTISKLVTSPIKEIPQPVISPQTAKTLLQAKLMEMPKANIIPPMPPPSHGSPGAAAKVVPLQINPQSVQLPTLMVKTALQATPVADVTSSIEISDGTPKSGRVRKKSAKVLEMEAFEEAERAKHNVKKGVTKPVTSPTTTSPKLTKLKPEDVQQKILMQKTIPVAGVTSPIKAEPMEQVLNTVTVQQALLQLPVMKTETTPVKNTLDTLKQPLSSKKSKKKKNEISPVPEIPQAPQITVTPKVTKTGNKSKEAAITGLRSDVDPMLSTSLLPDPSVTLMIKEEPGDGVDLGLISSETNNMNMSAVQKTTASKAETVTPAKKAKSKAKKTTTPESDVTMQEEGNKKASSVIKMLLSKPSQYTSPSVSTKTITTDKKSKQQKVTIETELTVDTTVKEEPVYINQNVNNSSELKSKLMLSPTDMDDDLPYEDEEEMYAEEDLSPESTGKKKVKKVKKKPKPKQTDIEDDSIDGSEDWEFETADGNLVIADAVPKSKTKKSPKKTKSGSSEAAYMDDTQIGYANSKKGKKSPQASAEKKKKRLTAYTMWCNTVRSKVLNDNPGIDFAQLSRRLGEIWQGLPSKDKMNWKRKAKREARKLLGKGLLITTGKGGTGASSTAANQTHGKSSTGSSNVQNTSTHQQHHHHQQQTVSKTLTFTKPEDSVLGSPTKSVLGTEPVDVAAHLKLLGESLGIIGMRLQEHRGLIAVQGSLSVLLDSLLCAVGPLMCLTSQVSEMNGCSTDTHARTLDHIAYIMPGL